MLGSPKDVKNALPPSTDLASYPRQIFTNYYYDILKMIFVFFTYSKFSNRPKIDAETFCANWIRLALKTKVITVLQIFVSLSFKTKQ